MINILWLMVDVPDKTIPSFHTSINPLIHSLNPHLLSSSPSPWPEIPSVHRLCNGWIGMVRVGASSDAMRCDGSIGCHVMPSVDVQSDPQSSCEPSSKSSLNISVGWNGLSTRTEQMRSPNPNGSACLANHAESVLEALLDVPFIGTT